MNPESALVRRVVMTLATWFGCGKSPKAPGTVGTVGATPLVWIFATFMLPLQYLLATITFSVFAIWVSHMHEEISGAHDASEVVIDEVAGFLVTMAWVPFTWTYVLLGFVLFRILDALKPWPISYLDREVKGGVGIVADDLLAGILSNIILQAVLQKGWLQ